VLQSKGCIATMHTMQCTKTVVIKCHIDVAAMNDL